LEQNARLLFLGVNAWGSHLSRGMKTLEGTKKIYTNVEKDNLIGSAFYKAKGFKVVSEFDDDFKGHLLKTVRLVLDM
jgi:ribosomal protein S18 acetylase RimI-like enzyme